MNSTLLTILFLTCPIPIIGYFVWFGMCNPGAWRINAALAGIATAYALIITLGSGVAIWEALAWTLAAGVAVFSMGAAQTWSYRLRNQLYDEMRLDLARRAPTRRSVQISPIAASSPTIDGGSSEIPADASPRSGGASAPSR